ncbi:MAG: hypothetical protein JSV48_11295, partial [Bradyrhizobium sp.]
MVEQLAEGGGIDAISDTVERASCVNARKPSRAPSSEAASIRALRAMMVIKPMCLNKGVSSDEASAVLVP